MLGLAAALTGAALGVINVPIMHFPPAERSGTYIDLQIGTPPQTVSAIFDTGSSTLALGTSSTTGSKSICPADQPLPYSESSDWSTENLNTASDVCVVGAYNPASSSTMQNGAGTVACNTPIAGGDCGFAVSYGTGAYGIEGRLVTDDLRMGGSSTRVSLGVITDMAGNWQQPPANGIFGVAMASLNCNQPSLSDTYGETCEPSAMTTFLEGAGLEDKFALCLGTATRPGVVSLGGADYNFYTGDMHYTSITNSEGYYSVDFTALGINGRQLCSGTGCTTGSSGGSGPIVDSGTPPLVLPSYAYQQLAATRDSCSSDSDCMVTMSIGDVCVNAAGLLSCQSGKCRIINEGTADATVTSMGSVNGGAAIIGNAAINQLYVEFDRSSSRVGFATRSGACSVECSAFLSVHSCQRAQCTWSGGSCTGGMGVGNSATGSRVSSGGSCMSGGSSSSSSENDDGSWAAQSSPATTKSSTNVAVITVAAVAAVAVVAVGAVYVLHNKRAARRAENAKEERLLDNDV